MTSPFPTIDIAHRISAVNRTVGHRTLAAGQARVMMVTRYYGEPVDEVWDACTAADRIGRWFLPVTGELRRGGRYQLENHAGGRVERCDPPHSYAVTWEHGDDISFVEVSVAEEVTGTRLTVEHAAHVTDDRWAEFGPGALGVGWDMILLGLTIHLESGAAITPAEGAAWSAGPDGVQFVTESSAAWGRAAVAAGEDPEAAEAAAARTTAAYTGATAEVDQPPAPDEAG